jgi:hypothetical protein
MDSARFSLTALSALSGVERDNRLRNLEAELAASFPPNVSREQFFVLSKQLIGRLKAIGHDLWGFDSDGEDFEIWCGDYSGKRAGGPLTVTFRYPGTVELGWSTSRRAG